MTNLIVPDRILWSVDLTKTDEELFSSKVLKRVSLPIYETQLKLEMLPSEIIPTIFLPMYEQLLMSRLDYRLDKLATREKLLKMATNEQYKLLWLTHKSGNTPIGGVVFRLLVGKASVAYRALDHELARQYGLRDLDYFVEVEMNKLLRQMAIHALSHGRDVHPVTQIGLSMFKMRSGARPKVASNISTSNYDENSWKALVARHQFVGYYADPNPVFYTKFYLYGDTSNELVESFVRIANRSGVMVVKCSGEDLSF